MLLLGLGGVGFSDLYVLGGRLSRRVLGKSGFSFWAGTLFYVHRDSQRSCIPVNKGRRLKVQLKQIEIEI